MAEPVRGPENGSDGAQRVAEERDHLGNGCPSGPCQAFCEVITNLTTKPSLSGTPLAGCSPGSSQDGDSRRRWPSISRLPRRAASSNLDAKDDTCPDDFIMRNAMDAQEVTVGWWPGDERYGNAAFYAYAHPAPEGFARMAASPPGAR